MVLNELSVAKIIPPSISPEQSRWQHLAAHQQVGVFAAEARERRLVEAEKHRRQHPDDGAYQVEGAEQQPRFAGCGGGGDARVTLDEGQLPPSEEALPSSEASMKPHVYSPAAGRKKPSGVWPEECVCAADPFESQRQDDDHGGRENQELQYIGHHDGPEAADGHVEDAEQSENLDTRDEGDADGRFDDAGDGVEERARRKERDGQKQRGVEFLHPGAESPRDVLGGP